LKARGHDICITLTPRQFPLLEKPYFSYASSQVPHDLATYHNALSQADAYVVITPEMNHAPSPGLINSLNHFGSSVFGFKPSAVVSYSPSQWGGTRAAHALRPVLSELGCLPVSAMIHFPRAHEIFLDDSGIPVSDEWNSYTDRCFSQLEWWTEATKEQRLRRDPYSASPAFTRNPLQRDAPSK
jgi:NAD(P)H-dependent FMN reductase